MTKSPPAGHNSEHAEKVRAFNEHLADYEEARFGVMRALSKCGHALSRAETAGFLRKEVQSAYDLGKMEPAERSEWLQSQFRIAGYVGIVAVGDAGQYDFNALFDQLSPNPEERPGEPLRGSKLSIVRARVDGFNSGKATKDGEEPENPWHQNDDEYDAWQEGLNEGLAARVPRKARKKKSAAVEVETEEAEDTAQPSGESPTPPAPRTRRSGKTADEALASARERLNGGGNSEMPADPAE